MKIYLSSMVFNNDIYEAVKVCEKEKFNLEFSSGIPYSRDLINTFLDAKMNKIIHNYFPAPRIPFTLNLASANRIIRNKSIEHCKKNIDLAFIANSSIYSFHSGFCVDPIPENLGGTIKKNEKSNIDKHKDFFIQSVNKLIPYAKKRKIKLLIENNVISQNNFLINQKQNLFLCTNSDEIIDMLNCINDSTVSLLLDTAHLKVSSKTLNNDIRKETEKLLPYIKLIHHSDNDGNNDSNNEFKKDYWFLDFKDYYSNWDHVIEVRNLDLGGIYNQINIIHNG